MSKGYWYNFKTYQHDYIEAPEDYHDYIPQIPPAQGMYECYIALGHTPIEASKKVLEAVVGAYEKGE